MEYGSAEWNISFFINENSHSGSKFPKFDKCAGWNKVVQNEFLKKLINIQDGIKVQVDKFIQIDKNGVKIT